MKVKRYLVNDLPEAVQMIRSDLGSDAVILNTKEIRIGGFLGMFRKKRVEVIAAVDEAAAGKPKPRPQPAAAAASGGGAAVAEIAAAVAASRRAAAAGAVALAPEREAAPAPAAAPDQPVSYVPQAALREKYGKAGGEGIAPSPRAADAAKEILANLSAQQALAAREAPAVATATEPPAASVPRPAAASLAAAESPPGVRMAAGPIASTARTEPAADDGTTALLKEIRTMKEMMMKMNREHSFRVFPEPVLKLARRLAEQGVEPPYVEGFAEKVSDLLADNPEPDAEDALAKAKEVLLDWIAPAAGAGISGETRIVNLVGPTGVGKTTTLAKLAADQAFVHRRSVGFITADTYRIAAVDQLRTYADILNMPLEVVFSPSELSRAYKKLEDRDLLLMDTAGRNYRNELFVSEVNSLLAPGQQAESVLVLSLTHKFADMKAVASQFAKYGVKRLLFTKMDETDSYGSILNLIRDFGFEVSYVTDGQTVPDDIRAFDPEAYVARLLGEREHE